MAYPFADSDFLSRRAIAAAAILALHALVAYLLATGLVRPPALSVPPPTIAELKFAPPRNPPPQRVPSNPAGIPLRLGGLVPPEIPPPPPEAVPGAPAPSVTGTAARPGTAFAAALRIIGRHQLPHTEDYYPPDRIRLGIQGAADVRVCVDEHGVRQGDPTVESSSGDAHLDLGAVNIARHGRYARAVQGDTPVPNCYRFHIVFKTR